jgi:ABC-type sulfate transport system permease subunit
MKRHLITLLLAIAAFLASLIAAVLVVYAYWYVDSWGYIHSPRLSPSDPHDAAALRLVALEVIIGLPVGALAGIAAAAIVVWKRWRRVLHREA